MHSLRRLGAVVSALLHARPAVRMAAQTSTHPNIVRILTDDVCDGDIGSDGWRDIRTPNADVDAEARRTAQR